MFELLKKKALARSALPLVCLLPCASAWATCTTNNVTVSFAQTVAIQRDAPIGTVLATAQTSMPISCDRSGAGSGDASWYVYLSPSNPDFGAAPTASTRATNYDGIGLQWTDLNSNTGTVSTVSNNALNNPTWNRGIAFSGVSTLTDTWTLVKTGPIASGTLTLLALSYIYKGSVSKKEMGALATVDFASVNVVAKSCSLNTPTVGVSLGRNSLAKFTGIGSTTNSVPFAIGLSCGSGTRVNVHLDVTADRSQPGTLQLTPGASTASGIGVQLLDAQNNPLPLNTSFLAGTAASEGLYNLNWNARYIQTSSSAISGSANATATFTLIYL